jgi:hypothetical protein
MALAGFACLVLLTLPATFLALLTFLPAFLEPLPFDFFAEVTILLLPCWWFFVAKCNFNKKPTVLRSFEKEAQWR